MSDAIASREGLLSARKRLRDASHSLAGQCSKGEESCKSDSLVLGPKEKNGTELLA